MHCHSCSTTLNHQIQSFFHFHLPSASALLSDLAVRVNGFLFFIELTPFSHILTMRILPHNAQALAVLLLRMQSLLPQKNPVKYILVFISGASVSGVPAKLGKEEPCLGTKKWLQRQETIVVLFFNCRKKNELRGIKYYRLYIHIFKNWLNIWLIFKMYDSDPLTTTLGK